MKFFNVPPSTVHNIFKTLREWLTVSGTLGAGDLQALRWHCGHGNNKQTPPHQRKLIKYSRKKYYFIIDTDALSAIMLVSAIRLNRSVQKVSAVSPDQTPVVFNALLCVINKRTLSVGAGIHSLAPVEACKMTDGEIRSAHYGINNCTGTLITTSDWISPRSHPRLMAEPERALAGNLDTFP